MADTSRVFVAGATGLTGTSIVQQLLHLEPSLLVRGTYHTQPPALVDRRVEYVKADLTRRSDCRKALSGCSAAILAAATTGGAGMAAAEPHRQMTDNLVMDALLLEAIYQEGIKRTIYLSSATVYQPFSGYVKEVELDWSQDPHPAYLGVGWAKRSAEKLCAFWHEKYGQEIIILRCANIYGPFAKFDPRASNFIPALIRKAVDRLDPFEIWGSPEVARDVIFSSDVAGVVGRLLVRDDIRFDVFNLGYGKTVTVGEVVNIVLKCTGHHPDEVLFSSEKPTTIGFRALDCSKLKQCLHWEPAHTITDGIGLTVDWWIKNKESWRR
jgi:GDP-L-fucose synthase